MAALFFFDLFSLINTWTYFPDFSAEYRIFVKASPGAMSNTADRDEGSAFFLNIESSLLTSDIGTSTGVFEATRR